MTDQLKPCPFCGGDMLHLCHYGDTPYFGGYYGVECKRCRAASRSTVEAEAIAAWNRRPEPKPLTCGECAVWKSYVGNGNDNLIGQCRFKGTRTMRNDECYLTREQQHVVERDRMNAERKEAAK